MLKPQARDAHDSERLLLARKVRPPVRPCSNAPYAYCTLPTELDGRIRIFSAPVVSQRGVSLSSPTRHRPCPTSCHPSTVSGRFRHTGTHSAPRHSEPTPQPVPQQSVASCMPAQKHEWRTSTSHPERARASLASTALSSPSPPSSSCLPASPGGIPPAAA